MKKLAIVALGAMLVVGGAVANEIVVPFWSDATQALPDPAALARFTFIGVYNGASTARTLIFHYNDDNAADQTPTANTFVLGPQLGLSFRPNSNDPGMEGAGSAIPDMNPGSGSIAGSVKISWNGGSASDITGRVMQVADISGTVLSAGYGLNL